MKPSTTRVPGDALISFLGRDFDLGGAFSSTLGVGVGGREIASCGGDSGSI